MRRRQFLALVGGGSLAATGGVAANNVLIGYGRLTGTNLVEQDLSVVFDERIGPVDGRTISIDGVDVRLEADRLLVDGRSLSWSASPDEVRRVEDDEEIHRGALDQLLADVPAIRRREHVVKAYGLEEFFEVMESGETRPHTVEALRGPRIRSVPPDVIERFSGVSPEDPHELAHGLVDGFHEHTFYDAPRYVAGSVEDNVLGRRVDLRAPFESPADFDSLMAGENTGTFCYDLTERSIEAMHAVPAADQTVPVVACYVRDRRHKHAYTGIATVLDGAGDGAGGPTLATTFVDYTATTISNDFGFAWLSGDDPDAYDTGHRATDVYWNRSARS